jgi:predicted kinase
MNPLESVRDIDLVLVGGVQGSGKTTLTLGELRDRVRINLDEIRTFYKRMTVGGEWRSDDWRPAFEPLYRKIEDECLRFNLQAGNRVVVDNTCITRKARAHYTALAKALDKTIGLIFLDLPLDDCLERNRNRKARVPEPVVHDFFRMREMPAADEGFDRLHVVAPRELVALAQRAQQG